ncbi:replication restart helicase PriA [Treponema sp. R6D11]
MKYVEVAILNIDRTFTYSCVDDIKIGQRVEVPFGRNSKKLVGIVVDIVLKPEFDTKEVIKIIDDIPILTTELINVARWLSESCFCTFYQSLKAIMPTEALSAKFAREKMRKYVKLVDNKYKAKTDAQTQVLEILAKDECALAELNNSAVKTLVKKGVVKVFERAEIRHGADYKKYKKTKPHVPTKEQKQAIDGINSDDTYLLFGVTGSGKTEVFLQVIDRVLKEGKEAIVLVPEISLTPQMVERFVSRFGDKVSVLHSSLSKGEKFDEWQKILRGETKIAIGARSSVFAPFDNLGVIIVDEEQESSYKSDMSPKYDAREVAKIRANNHSCPLVLASATPSVNSYYKAKQGEYKLLELLERTNKKNMPEVDIVDMRKELLSGNMSMFSEQLKNEIRKNIDKGEQTILLLNRRGYHTFVSCRNCGESIKCKNCDVTLTYHKKQEKLVCHTCGFSQDNVKICPSCGSHYIRYFGDGTQKVETEIEKYFPDATYIRMDFDTTSVKGGHEAVLDEFRDKKIDILIGTQMVAKGLDFPDVTLAAVLAADQTLNISDFRSFERSFSLFTQVCGRSGRGDKKGRAIIQSYTPDHYVLKYAKEHNYKDFYEKEIFHREQYDNPPFSDIIMFLCVGEDETVLKSVLERAVKMLSGEFKITLPAPAPIERMKGLLRYRTLIKANMTPEIEKMLLAISKEFSRNKDYIFNIYINPISML